MTNIKNTIDYRGMKKLIEEISKQYSVKVGLLSGKGGGDSVVDRDGNVSNEDDYAGLGAKMEFGDEKIPARSFLQMPLETRSKEIVQKTKGDFSKQELEYYLGNDILHLIDFAVMLGANATEVVQEAFDTRGFGQWKPNAPYTIKKKGSDMPLIDTGALRQHITFEVKGNDITL